MLSKFTYINLSKTECPSFFIKKTDCWVIESDDNFKEEETLDRYIKLFSLLEKKNIKTAVLTDNLKLIQDYTPDFVFVKTSQTSELQKVLETCIIYGSKLVIIEDRPLDETIKEKLLKCNRSLRFTKDISLEDCCFEIFPERTTPQEFDSPLTKLLNIPISYGETDLVYEERDTLSENLLQNIRNMLLHKVVNKKQSRFFYLLNLKEDGLFERAIVPISTPVIEFRDRTYRVSLRAEEREDNDGITPKLLPRNSISCLFKVSNFYTEDKLSEYLIADVIYNSLLNLFKDFNLETETLVKKGQDIFYQDRKLYSGEIFVDSFREHGVAGASLLHMRISDEKDIWDKYNITPIHEAIGIKDICEDITIEDVKEHIFKEVTNIIESKF